MWTPRNLLAAICFVAIPWASHVAALPLQTRADPTVVLGNATVTGFNLGSVSSYLGIPFAQPP